MNRLLLLLLIPVIGSAQDLLTRGTNIYNQSCATGYCHGLKGVSAGAPRLAARGFDEAYIAQTVRAGISGTAMPAFGTTLDRADLAAVVTYVASLNGIAPSRNPAIERGPPPRTFPPEATRGRSLFYEATRGFNRCSTCHQVDGMGIAVADPMAKVPDSVAALRAVPSPHVVTATADGGSFPALILSKGGTQTKLYDLTTSPPVLRTFPAAAVSTKEGSEWKHSAAIATYQDADLEAVLAFLRIVVRP